jgi:hypothetical protein
VQVEEAVAEAVTGLDEGAPRLWSADAVDVEAPGLLETTDSALGEGAVPTVDATGVESGAQQAALEIADMGALRTNAERP